MRARMAALVVALVTVLLSSAMSGHGGVVRAEAVSTPLCEVVYGFANEYNDHVQLPIAHTPATASTPTTTTAALVLAVHPYMMHPSFASQLWVQMNVTYYTSSGTRMSRLSDASGLLVLADVAAGRDVDVRFGRHGAGAPLPFSFYSLYANARECYVHVSATRPFHAVLPRTVTTAAAAGATAATRTAATTVYFATTLPPSDTAVALYAITDLAHKQPVRVYDERGGEAVYASGDVITARTPGSTLLFSVTLPAATTPATAGNGDGAHADDVFVIVYVERVERSGGAGEGGGVAPLPQPSQGPTPSPSPRKPSRSWLATLLLLALVVAVAYVVVGSYYNYTRLGKTHFPEMVPHVEYVRAAARCVSIACARVCGGCCGAAAGGVGGAFVHDGYDAVEVRYNTHAYAT